jgi:membrane protein required for colicin V production
VNIVDPILLGLLLLFALRGYFKGLFREVFSLLGLVVGFMVAVRYDEPVAAMWAASWTSSYFLLRAITFVSLFFLAYFGLNLVGWLLHRSASLLFLQGINRIGGVVVGAGKGAALLALLIFFLTSSPFLPSQATQRIHQSFLAPLLSQFAQGLILFGRANLPTRGDAESGEQDGYI